MSENLFEQQASNRRKSRWLVAVFVLFFAWLGLGGDIILYLHTHEPGYEGYRHVVPLIGIVISLIAGWMVVSVRETGAEKVLWSTGARELTEVRTDGERQLVNVVEEMAIASGVSRPRIYLIEDPDPNAFVTGTDPLKAHLAVTTGLVEALDRDELQGVVAHEMGHVKNLDMQLMTMVAGLAGAVALLADGVGRMIFRGGVRSGGGGRRSSKSKGGGGGALVLILLVVWLLSWLLAPIVTRLLAMGISRKREYLADAMAAQFTRNPMALASALDKIEKAGAPTKAIRGGVAHLCIADPLGRPVGRLAGGVGDFFGTHPPMSMRVARLKAMAFQAQKAARDQLPE